MWPIEAVWQHSFGVNTGLNIALLPDRTIVDLSSVSDNLIRAISQEIPQPSINKISSKITYLKFHSVLLRAIEFLAHWGRVTHICVSDLTIIGSDNGLSPGRRQAIIWTNAGILLIGPLGTNFSEILIEILIFSSKKMRLKVSSAKWRPFCLGLNVLTRLLMLETEYSSFWVSIPCLHNEAHAPKFARDNMSRA